MPIIHCPETPAIQDATCAVCGEQKPLRMLSVGMRSPSGKQAFTCNVHLAQGYQLVRGWTDYMIAHTPHLPFTDMSVSENTYARAIY